MFNLQLTNELSHCIMNPFCGILSKVLPEKRSLKMIKNYSVQVNWFVFLVRQNIMRVWAFYYQWVEIFLASLTYFFLAQLVEVPNIYLALECMGSSLGKILIFFPGCALNTSRIMCSSNAIKISYWCIISESWGSLVLQTS